MKPFSNEEILVVLNACNGDKDTGPDGMIVVKDNWIFLREDFIRCSHDFHASEKFIANLNSTFISIIPKKGAKTSNI